MRQWIRTLDGILRGEATRLPALREGKINVPLLGLTIVIDLLGCIYGICMGLFSVAPGGSHHAMQLVATTIKVPALFLLTLLVTFPSLYVFSALVGSQLRIKSVLQLLIASMAVMLAVLASIGPIVAFFSFTTTSYEFMVLLNVLVFTIAGVLGLAFLLQTLHRMSVAIMLEPVIHPPQITPPPDPAAPPDASATPTPVLPSNDAGGPLDQLSEHMLSRHVKIIFRVWVLVFALVGSQMGWVLRPFIGHPDQPFTWFRAPGSNFFQAVINAARALIG